MALLRNRPLATACILLILVAAAVYWLSFLAHVILSAIVAIVCILLLICRFFKRSSYFRFLLFLMALGIFLGMGRVLIERAHAKALFEGLDDTEVTAEFVVEKTAISSIYQSEYLVKLRSLNGESCNAGAVVTADAQLPFSIGDRISGRFVCTYIEQEILETQQRTAYLSDGTYGILSLTDEGSLQLQESGNNSIRSRLNDFRYALHEGIADAVEGEAGALTGALLLGTREDLNAGTVRDFRRVGLSHLLAISGLHLAILVGLLEGFLRLLRFGKRPRIAVVLLFCIGYLILTGCSFSMLRSVLMLILLYSAFVLGGSYDGFTALCFGGALMVMATPGAVFDLSFQMTMLATFGILAFGELQGRLQRMIPRRKGSLGLLFKAARAITASLFMTLCATLAILPIQWLIFGEMSIVSPIANLAMLPLTPLLLGLGMIVLLLTAFGLPALPFAVPARWLAEAMLRVTRLLSPGECMVSLKYRFVPYIFIPLFVLTAVLLLVDLKKLLRPLVLAPAAVAIVAFVICLNISRHVGLKEMTMVYRNTGSSEGLVLIQNDKTVICDISNGSQTQLYEDFFCAKELGATEVDVLLLTHYHNRQTAALSRFCESVLVRSVWLPDTQTDADADVLASILSVMVRENIPVTIYQSNAPLTVFTTGSISLSDMLKEKRSTEPAFRMDIRFGQTALRYESGAYSEYARQQGVADEEKDFSYLILGSHGPNPHKEIAPLGILGLQEVWIANEAIAMQYEIDSRLRYVILPEERSLIFQ